MLESIAFIPDGNRRYAEKEGISFEESYNKGVQKFWSVLEWLSKYSSIKTCTFYAFSIKNFDRSKNELNTLMRIFEEQLVKAINAEIDSDKEVGIKFIGRTDLFSPKLREGMKKLEEKTSNYSDRVVYLALGYDGQSEIVDASKKFAKDVLNGVIDVDSLTPQNFSKYLYSDVKFPDLIVRTSNEHRLSGFLTYQSSYSELAFLNKFWPEVSESDIDRVVKDFEERNRRFGK
ncbi:MAG: Tritrans,polycis-undecaprenyl-diphosphate synthase (GGDP specific) [archaeon ADurb.Bin336]|nr:MAG: Tritrans,polycis-undecaprenyl-diphosphate synthase (GGDP specific) [archaeon ADurb.Bin336]